MSRATLSLIIRCSYDPQADITLVRIEHVETGEAVRIHDGSFLMRCSFNGRASVQRCLIRHIASGREAYVQIGPGLRDFIKTCLLDTSESSGHA
jgi:hypothetical protein